MNKRGQVALFVIIAIVIVAAIVLLYVFKPSILSPALSAEESQKIVSSQVQPVRDYVIGCMNLVSRKTLNTMGRQGGYFIPRAERATIPFEVMVDAPIISYSLFYDSSRMYINYLPSLNKIKEEFASGIVENEEFLICINDFQPFKKIVDVGYGDLVLDASRIDMGETSGQIVIPFGFQVVLNKGNVTTIVDDYVVRLPINIARIRETSARIVNSIASGNNYMEVIDEENLIQWDELRNDFESEKIFLSSQSFYIPPTEISAINYNEKNLLFKLQYQRPSLETPFDYYLLIGLPE